MVEEVNRLLGNLLAAGEQVALPGVGTLSLVTRPARRLTKRLVMPPLREVEFTATQQGKSLPARLAEAAGCPAEQAEEIYGRWLGHTREGEVLTLLGIGTLKGGRFTPESGFDARLNPQGRKPLTVRRKRRFDWSIFLGIAAILITAGIAFYGYQHFYGVSISAPVTTSADSAQTVHAPLAQEQAKNISSATTTPEQTPTGTTPAQASATAATAPQPTHEPTHAPVAETPQTHPSVMTLTSGRYYVVLGVFSSPENAERAVAQAAEADGTLRSGIYRFGQKWMVSPFESDDTEACALFRKAHADRFPEMWVYKAR